MDNQFNFSNMQRGQRALKRKKRIKKTVNVIASIVLIFSILLGGAMGAYIFGIGNIKINDESAETETFESLKTSEHSGVSYVLVCGLCPPEEGGKLTDTIIIACLDHNKKTLNFLQIPRDLYIGDEDGSIYGGGKINAVYASPRKGESNVNSLRRVIAKYLGIPLDHYVLFNIPAVIDLIDSVGGLTINVQQKTGISIMDYNTKGWHKVGPGWVTLKGSLAVGFIRKRTGVKEGFIRGDADRVQNQQLAYVALAKKLKSMSVTQMVTAAKNCYPNISTDISLNDILGYALEVKGMSMDSMGVYAVPGQYSQYNHSSVYCIHKQRYLNMFNEHFNPYGAELTDDDILAYEWFREMGQSYDESDEISGGTLASIAENKNQ